MKMGETRVKVRLHGPKGSDDVEMLVDTGASLTKIPEGIATGLGIAVEKRVQVVLADGSLRDRGLAEVRMEIAGEIRTIPLLVGPDGEEALLGLTSLEIFRLKVNPITHKLEPSKWIEYAVSVVVS